MRKQSPPIYMFHFPISIKWKMSNYLKKQTMMRTQILVFAILLQVFLVIGIAQNVPTIHRKIIFGQLPKGRFHRSGPSTKITPNPPRHYSNGEGEIIFGQLPKNMPIPPTSPSNRSNHPPPSPPPPPPKKSPGSF